MRQHVFSPFFSLCVVCLLNACARSAAPASQQEATTRAADCPVFSADSAMAYVEQQCQYGARVPGTEAWKACGEWMEQELRRRGAKVEVQRGEVTAYDGTVMPVCNLFAAFRPEATMRVLLVSHWDSRPIADQDPEATLRRQPVMGANDGASGVGVLLELARLMADKQPTTGVDLLFVDAEDNGAPDSWPGAHEERFWAMGTQLWCKDAAQRGYRAQYGILLDMVGSPAATFYREYYSDRYASSYVDLVWQTAASLGYTDLFRDTQGGGITDDHVFINRMLNLPTLDIIDTRREEGFSFCPEWHTTHDTPDHLSTQTLYKVGHTLTHLLW